jgi:integrase
MAKSRRGRGEGSIEELPSGKWRAILSDGIDPATGRRHKRTFTADTKAAVLRWLRERLQERDAGTLAHCGRLTVAEWSARFLAFKQERVSARSLEPYELHCRAHIVPKLGAVPLASLRPHHIADLYSALARDGASAAQVRNVGKTVRVMLREAVRQRLIAVSPAVDVARPRAVRPEMQVWTRDEACRFFSACRGERLEALFVLALDTGARQGELLALSWRDVDLQAGAVRVLYTLEEPKKAPLRRKEVKTPCSRRRVALSPAALSSLHEHRQRLIARGGDVASGPVFPNQKGGWLQPSHIRKRDFRRVIRRAGVPKIRFHDLRHTHASLSLAAGASLKAVSTRLGHSSPAFTLKTYVHHLPEQEQALLGYWNTLINAADTPNDVGLKSA